MSEGTADIKGYADSGLRLAQLAALLGLTGFAVSQPVLSVAGENPTLFTFAGLKGSALVVFALVVAFVPPLILWALVVAAGRVDRRAGDVVFVAAATFLVAATTVQVMKTMEIERGAFQVAGAVIAASAFALLLVRVAVVAVWVRYTAPLPLVAVGLMLVASPSAQLLRTPGVAAARVGSGGLPSVVFIMLDELPTQSILAPDGEIDAERFPNLAAFHDDATWYSSYSVMAGTTTISIPSILSSQEPRDVPPLWTEHPNSLFSLLAPTHDLSVSETLTLLCGYEDCGVEGESATGGDQLGMRSVLGEVVDVWNQRVTPGRAVEVDLGQFAEEPVALGPTDHDGPNRGLGSLDEVTALPTRVVDFLDALEPGPRSTLNYLHVMLPHQPWVHYPDGQSHLMAGEGTDRPDTDDTWKRATDEQIHLLQAQYADRIVGEVLDRLRQTGTYEESVIVVTADHGVSFDEAPYRWIRDGSVAGLAHVPLLVKGAGQVEGAVDGSNLWGVDLLPLLAGEVGVDITWPVEGFVPGSDGIRARGDRKVFYDFGNLSREFQGIRELDARLRPNTDDRLVGPLTVPGNEVSGLISRLGVDGLLGRPADELGAEPHGEIVVEALDLLTDPPADGSVLGRVWGQIDGVETTDDAVALVAMDGVVVSASPLGPADHIDALLPPGVQDPSGSSLRVVVLDGGRALEPEVVARSR